MTQTLTFDEKNWPANWTYSNMDKEEVDMKNHKYVLTPSFVNGTSENGTLRYAFNVEVRFYTAFYSGSVRILNQVVQKGTHRFQNLLLLTINCGRSGG